jgi:hypothetical protein
MNVWEELRPRLERLSRPFTQDPIALAEKHREEVAPRLLEALETLVANPVVDDDYTLHLFAMHLLAAWRDARALQPLLSLASLRDHEALENLLGDHTTESLGRCLASVSGGHVDALWGLCEDKGAYTWCRTAGLDALQACVIEGDADRDDVVARLQGLGAREAHTRRTQLASKGPRTDVLEPLVILATDLGAAEMLPAIRTWFGEGLIDHAAIRPSDVEHHIMRDAGESLRLLRASGEGYLGDVWTEITWWACFSDGKHRSDQWEPVRHGEKIGRNDPCPCGSGKKYKKCHGA